MNIDKSILLLSILVIVSILVFTGCPESESSGNSGIEVGAEIGNGFVVSYVDPQGGIEAERTVDTQLEKKVSGTFENDRTWTSDAVWYLDGSVFIGDDSSSTSATLTIEAGTIIKGIPGITPGLLVITRYSQINAVGTALNPIVFTSAMAEGERDAGDWGGLVINGRAPTNEGVDVAGEGNSGLYGGNVPDDNSGTLMYVRVEFAGRVFTSEDELNGIAFQGVGSGTTVDYIQVHQNKDDGVEFFGGTVNVSHVVITGCQDDSLDWTSGWQGSAQYVVIQHYPNSGDRGIEADNLEANHAAAPVSNPTIANLTMIANDSSDVGILLRRGTQASIYNSIISGFDVNGGTGSIEQDSAAATGINYNGILADTLLSNDDDTTATQNNFDDGTGNTDSGTTNLPAAAYAAEASGDYSFDFMPTSAPSGATAQALPVDLDSAGSSFVGAIEFGGTDWTTGWITTSAH